MTTARTRPRPTAPDTRWTALYVLCSAVLMIVLDVTVVNVALPTIQDDLGFSSAGLAWVVNSYLIAFAGLLLLSGRLGDLLGRRRVLLHGLVVFTVASFACGLASSQEVLVIARFVQGVGGALASAVVLGMIVTLFPEPGEQAKALGVYGFVASAGGAVGLVVGGVITEAVDWHWIFLVNVPIGIAVLVLVRRVVPDDAGLGMAAGADLLGAALVTGALMTAVYALVAPAAEHGFSDGRTLGLLAVAAVLLLGFVVRQHTAATPLMPLRLFTSRITVAANVVQALTVAGMFGMFFLTALFLQRVQGYDALELGLAFLPSTVVMALVSLRVSDRVIGKVGAQPTLVAGSALAAVGLALFGRLPVQSSYLPDVLPGVLLVGIGMGVAFPALMALAMADATEEDAGLASGLVNTTAEAGAALGLAVLATLAAARTESIAGVAETTDPVALTSGFRLGFVVAAGLLAAATAVAAAALRPDAAKAEQGEARGAQPVAG